MRTEDWTRGAGARLRSPLDYTTRVRQMGMAADATTAMTIDFLRARLLSERSVSRAAKERADHLAKRVNARAFRWLPASSHSRLSQ